MWVLGVTGLVPGADQLRPPVRRLGGDHRADPLPRPDSRRRPAGALRARRPSVVGGLGGDPVPVHPPDRGSRRRPERDGERPAPASAARHLRAARRRRDLRLPGILVALPLLAACRAAWEFFSERVQLEPWPASRGARYRWRSRSSRHARRLRRRSSRSRPKGRTARTARPRPRPTRRGRRTRRRRSSDQPPAAYSSTVSTFPATRLRRLRRTGALRELVARDASRRRRHRHAALRRDGGAARTTRFPR